MSRNACAGAIAIVLLASFKVYPGQQQQVQIRELEADTLKTEFVDHEFLSSYRIYEMHNKGTRISFLQQITNASNFEAKEIQWNSAGIIIPGLAKNKQY